jgi:hypothetical protein
MLAEATSVTVVAAREELAAEQVKVAEQQHVLGLIPNFYANGFFRNSSCANLPRARTETECLIEPSM